MIKNLKTATVNIVVMNVALKVLERKTKSEKEKSVKRINKKDLKKLLNVEKKEKLIVIF